MYSTPKVNQVAREAFRRGGKDPDRNTDWQNGVRQVLKNVATPGFTYFEKTFFQTGAELAGSVEYFRGAECFHPDYFLNSPVTFSELKVYLHPVVPGQMIDKMEKEVEIYRKLAVDAREKGVKLENPTQLLNWWKEYGLQIPSWDEAAQLAGLILPSSMAVERVFSILQRHYGPQRRKLLRDAVEHGIMLAYNRYRHHDEEDMENE